jgi:hypothetical protein
MTISPGPARSGADVRRLRLGHAGLRGRGRSPLLLGVALAAVALVALVLGLVVSGAFSSKEKKVAVTSVTADLSATADASVFAASPDANHGASRALRVDGSPVVRSYLRFDLSRLTGRVASARLSLDPLTAHPLGVTVALAPGGWGERQITYATAPTPGARVALTGPLAAAVRTTIDVTRFVRGRRELDLALVGLGSRQIALASREQGTLGPRLTVVTKRGQSPSHAGRPGRGHASVAPGAAAATAGIMAAGPNHDPLIAAAGDIACDPTSGSFGAGNGTSNNCHEKVVSDMLLRIHPNTVLPLGDNQYECGDLSAFQQSYAPTWGRLRAVTRPIVGNHEYGEACHRSDASPYFSYFGASAGPYGRGWYSYNIGSWHLIALNSECSYGRGRLKVGGCEAGSAQERWLRRDLATHPRRCTLAYWHEPRFSSGQHGDAQQMARIWNDLARVHADVVLSGHNHDYERFNPIGAVPGVPVATGATKPPNFQEPILHPGGIREFVVGTGGKNHYPFAHASLKGEVVRNADTYGVLLLRLRPRGYSWRFVPEPGKTFTDSGTGSCS